MRRCLRRLEALTAGLGDLEARTSSFAVLQFSSVLTGAMQSRSLTETQTVRLARLSCIVVPAGADRRCTSVVRRGVERGGRRLWCFQELGIRILRDC
mmetsp:Transcript_76373/g.212167  ORF Transcript_76373/g.212167 Transcript_76373/m.212167 type:complete len:97 (-) Transcript_76373:13-303(-)